MTYVDKLNNKLGESKYIKILEDVIEVLDSDMQLAKEDVKTLTSMINESEQRVLKSINKIGKRETNLLHESFYRAKMLLESRLGREEARDNVISSFDSILEAKKTLSLWKILQKEASNMRKEILFERLKERSQ